MNRFKTYFLLLHGVCRMNPRIMSRPGSGHTRHGWYGAHGLDAGGWEKGTKEIGSCDARCLKRARKGSRLSN